MRYAFCHSMGKCKTVNKGGTNLQKGASPFHHHRIGKMVTWYGTQYGRSFLGEEVLSHPDASPKIPFRFRRTSQLPSERSVSSKHRWDHSPTPKDRRHYCIQVRAMLARWRRWSTPTVLCIGRMFHHWHTPGSLTRRPNNQSHSCIPRGGHPLLW